MEKAYLGGISVTVEVPNIELKNREEVRLFRKEMRIAHEQGIKEGKDILKSILSSKKYFASGNLMESVASRLFIKTEEIFSGTVHFNNPGREYAYFVEHGRGPGLPPPIDRMIAWGRHRNKTYQEVMKIRSSIAQKGTKARPFMDNATERVQENYNEIVERALERFRSR